MLKFDIVSPYGKVISDIESEKIVVESLSGQITILPGHRDMVSLLGRGLIYAEGVNDKFVVYGGILQVFEGFNVSVIADRIVKVVDLDENFIKQSIKEIEIKLNSNTIDDKDYQKMMSEYLDKLAELGSVLS